MEMKQVFFIDRVIETLVLNDGMAKSKFTPSELKKLVEDSDGSAPCGNFIYIIVVGILL